MKKMYRRRHGDKDAPGIFLGECKCLFRCGRHCTVEATISSCLFNMRSQIILIEYN